MHFTLDLKEFSFTLSLEKDNTCIKTSTRLTLILYKTSTRLAINLALFYRIYREVNNTIEK